MGLPFRVSPYPPALRSALVAGATGLVGRSLVSLLARDPQVPWIRLPLRRTPERAFDTPHGAKLRPTVVDFAHLDRNAALFEADQVFVCLGTTIKDAGSREAFRRVDFDYVLSVAKLGAAGGARDLLVVTAGARVRAPISAPRRTCLRTA